MRPFLLTLLLAAASAAFADDTPSLNGKWQIQRSAAGNESTQDCTFTQKDNDLTGSCTSADSPSVQITGKVEGKKVTMTYKSEYNGSPLTVVYNGTVESATKIAGTLTAVEFGVEGVFTATKSE